MSRRFLPTISLTRWLTLSALLLLLLPLGHALFMSRAYSDELRARELAALDRRLASTLQVVREEVEQVQSILETLAQSDAAAQGDWRGLHAHARRVVQAHPELLAAITLANAEKRLVFGTPVPFDQVSPMAGEPAGVAQVLATGRVALSSPFQSPYPRADGGPPRWGVAVGVPVDTGHVLRGIVRCDQLRDMLLALNLGDGWLASVTDRRGVLIARTQAHDDTVGKMVNPPMAQAIGEARPGAFELASREGTEYVAQVGFLPGGDWSVQVGVARSELTHSSTLALRRIAAFYAVELALLGLLGWFIARRMASGLGAVMQVGADVVQHRAAQPLRTGIRELDQLQERFGTLAQEQQALLDQSRSHAARLDLFVGHAPVALAMLDRELRYVAVSQRWIRDFGLQAQGLIGASHGDVMPQLAQRWAWAQRRALLGEPVPDEEDRVPQPDGGERWLRREVLPWFEHDGRVGGVLILAEDITARKTAEQRLRDTQVQLEQGNRRFLQAMDAAAEGLWDWNLASDALYLSPGFAAMLGQRPEDLAPGLAGWTGLLHPADAAGVPEEARRRLDGPGHFELEYRLRHAGGGYRWVLSRGKVVERDAGGRPLRAMGTHVDITAVREARAAAEQLSQARSDFLANMSHEIRTPLNGVLGLAQIGYRDSAATDKARGTFKGIIDSGRLLLSIVNDVLDLAKIESGSFHIDSVAFDPAQVVADALRLQQPAAESKGLVLRVERGQLPSACLGDPVRIAQVLVNLLSNAVKFTPSGTIVLRAFVEDGALAFDVGDTGIGIAPELLERIFQPFEQGDTSSTRRHGGTGLGLAIARRFAELMGGTLTATSAPGRGSTFSLRLPLRETDARPRAATAPPPADTRRLPGWRLLVAEDNPVNRLVIEDMLQHEGAEVVVVDDGQQAVDAVLGATTPFDAVLLDVQMPVLDGVEATRRLRRTHPDLPVIGQTAHALTAERERFLLAGMSAIVSKPFDIDQVVAALLAHARPAP